MDNPSVEPDQGETRREPASAGKSMGAFSLGTFFVADKESTLQQNKHGVPIALLLSISDRARDVQLVKRKHPSLCPSDEYFGSIIRSFVVTV